MTTVTTAPEAEYWLQTGWMEEPGAELGIRKPVTIDRKTNLHEHRAYWCVRRTQDIFFSLLALIALSPLMLLTCIAVWIDSPGASPVFSQLRVGRNGKLVPARARLQTRSLSRLFHVVDGLAIAGR